MKGRMDDLARLAAMVRDRDLAKVESVLAEIRVLRADIDRLREARAAREASGALDLARLTGVEVGWMKASEAEIIRKNMELARLMARHEAALNKARRAFGRADVAGRLAKRD